MGRPISCDGLLEQRSTVDATEPTDVVLPAQEDGQVMKRDQWSGKLDFLFSCIGFAVGLGNVWRFPYLCYKNGGGAFFIPYFLCLVCGGIPVFFLELSLGQFMQQGGVGVWNICPILQGIGIATTVIVFLMNIYYIVIMAWTLFYASHCFHAELPWALCNNTWNTAKCAVSCAANNSLLSCNATVDPVIEFWERRILQISPGIDEPNGFVWQLVLSLFIAWTLVYFSIWKGLKVVGKVVWFTATFPYLVLAVLLVRGVSLPGAMNGLRFYLLPDMSRLADSQVWIDAGTQIFFSYAIALGAMTALGSYNHFRNNCYRDCLIISLVNSGTSILAGFVIFSVLGFMAQSQGVSVKEVAESGPGLAFIIYPKALSVMPLAPLWAVLFFCMLLFIGLGSQFVGVQSFITVLMDFRPQLLKYKELCVLSYCSISFLLGLPMVTRGGMYVFQLFDYYSASGLSLLWVCLFECIAVSWIYGECNFMKDVELMLRFRVSRWFPLCWTVLTPAVTAAIFLFTLIRFKPLSYNRIYIYPVWAQTFGLSLAVSSMICIPLFVLWKLYWQTGSLSRRLAVLCDAKLPQHVKIARTEENSHVMTA